MVSFPSMAGKLRWGILGTGNIARQFSVGLAASRRGALAGVGSRRKESADAFAQTHHIPSAYGSYEQLIADVGVDVVYNSLPNSLHHEWTIRALQAGKHVLCEKPLAMNATEAREMFDAARKADRVLMEAFMYRSHPLTLAVQAAVKSGAIGELRLIRSSFCYRTRKIQGNVRFVRELGGGGLMDIGCYCVNFARLLASQEPVKISAFGQFHAAGVDDLVAATMVFPGGVISSFTCGMSVQADNTAYLCGTEGYLEVPIPWKPPQTRATYVITRGIPPKMDSEAVTRALPPPRDIRHIDAGTDLYAVEADDFAATIFDGLPPRITEQDSMGNMKVLDEMRRQIGLEFGS